MALLMAPQHYRVRRNYGAMGRDTKAQRHNPLTISIKPTLVANTTYHGIFKIWPPRTPSM